MPKSRSKGGKTDLMAGQEDVETEFKRRAGWRMPKERGPRERLLKGRMAMENKERRWTSRRLKKRKM
jgi:hypothetical protein